MLSFFVADDSSRPLELQRCHPQQHQRFLLFMVGDPMLTRIDDSAICPLSNYKALMLARRTTVLETIRLLIQICRVSGADERKFKLCLVDPDGAVELPSSVW